MEKICQTLTQAWLTTILKQAKEKLQQLQQVLLKMVLQQLYQAYVKEIQFVLLSRLKTVISWVNIVYTSQMIKICSQVNLLLLPNPLAWLLKDKPLSYQQKFLSTSQENLTMKWKTWLLTGKQFQQKI